MSKSNDWLLKCACCGNDVATKEGTENCYECYNCWAIGCPKKEINND